mmetsp:Transcript_2926/g.7007  ORF Transcript_2926/g.7007 Transcript_2926/m.7007 type:complete len:220 (+) Transcript_2926:2110-2769(+)|eukprot:405540-Hanusia_phi.AAC.9
MEGGKRLERVPVPSQQVDSVSHLGREQQVVVLAPLELPDISGPVGLQGLHDCQVDVRVLHLLRVEEGDPVEVGGEIVVAAVVEVGDGQVALPLQLERLDGRRPERGHLPSSPPAVEVLLVGVDEGAGDVALHVEVEVVREDEVVLPVDAEVLRRHCSLRVQVSELGDLQLAIDEGDGEERGGSVPWRISEGRREHDCTHGPVDGVEEEGVDVLDTGEQL